MYQHQRIQGINEMREIGDKVRVFNFVEGKVNDGVVTAVGNRNCQVLQSNDSKSQWWHKYNEVMDAEGIPKVLNGYEVIRFVKHDNDYASIMVYRPKNYMPYVIATWWPELKSGWMWGHYENESTAAYAVFEQVCDRNSKRS